MKKLTSSQVRSFKNCRRRYFFEYVELLRPKASAAPLNFGSAYHVGVAAFLRDEDWQAKLQAYADANPEMEPLQALIAAEAVHAFIAAGHHHDWEVLAIEEEFALRVDDVTVLVGKQDGMVKTAGMKLVLEHKTTAKLDEGYWYRLLWDDQASSYILDAVARDPEVEGMLYCVVQKPGIKPYQATPMDERKYTKDDKLYASQHEFDEPQADYLGRVADWYAEKERVHVRVIRRNTEQLQFHAQALGSIADEIDAAKHLDRFYPNPEACSIFVCPFQSICLEYTPEAVEGLFDKKTTTNEELETDGVQF